MISPRSLSVNLASRYLRIKAIHGEALPTNMTSTASESPDALAELIWSKNVCPTCAKPRSDSVSKNINNITNVNSHNYRTLGGGDAYGGVDNINDNVNANIHNSRQTIAKIPKLTKVRSEAAGLKRVSFGSSKDSMVETLFCLECGCDGDHTTPTYNRYTKVNTDKVGIEVQKDSARSIVRVSTYQCKRPQHILAPKYFKKHGCTVHNTSRNFNRNCKGCVTKPILNYDRQQSTDYGWDNPFRPGGDLSREADEIVKTVSNGKPITPAKDQSKGIIKARENDTNADKVDLENVATSNVPQNQSAQNDTTYTTQTVVWDEVIKPVDNNDMTSLAQVLNHLVPEQISASQVIIGKKKGCCVIQ